MADALVCYECGRPSLEFAFGPHGFTQRCRSCGASLDLDDVMEPVAVPLRMARPFAMAA